MVTGLDNIVLKGQTMKPLWLRSSTLWKDGIVAGFAVLTVVETILAISGVSLDRVWGEHKWYINLLFVLVALFVIIIIAIFIKMWCTAKKGVMIKIRGITVNIKQGDIFKADGWKVISFNEYLDTVVDDKIIAHNTLNGIFINRYADLDELQKSIEAENNNNSLLKPYKKNGRLAYPLGRIIIYKDYMLLALTHFNEQNEAHLNQTEYEDCLRSMWKEICRVYANKPIFLPLLGSGITRFDGTPHKSKFELLKCMLCTLGRSEENINQTITILLDDKTMQEIDIYEIERVK